MKKKVHRLLTISILTSMTGAGIFAVNKLINASAVLRNALHNKSQYFYDWKFGRIHYTVEGSGSPLLLLHDLSPMSSSAEWKSLKKQLAKDHTVYCMDLLGCGCSDRPKITYTNFLYVQLITDFIKSVIKQPTDVMTSGLSGSFVIMACKNDASIIRRIMMINPEDLAVLNQIPDRRSKSSKFLLELPLIGSLVYNILNSRPNIDLVFTEKYLHNPFHVDTELEDLSYESAHLENGAGKYLLASITGKYIFCNISHALKTIDNSIYILQGASEPRAQESVALYTSINPAIESEIIQNTKHLPQIEAPEQVLEAVKIFFAS